ncbi:MAG TPA: type II toxin-antitoxin system RelE/ParE family toxin [Steroidobacteraceae bacterium]|nr:type II toxin-antitoxin system RelE/ParE family toxin [Steroidobacteraceae bacterium]
MVNWSQRARADLKAAHDYIAKDSPQNAKVVAREIRRRADGIEAAPLGGRKVPELNDEQVREIPAYSWRILISPTRGPSFHRHPRA